MSRTLFLSFLLAHTKSNYELHLTICTSRKYSCIMLLLYRRLFALLRHPVWKLRYRLINFTFLPPFAYFPFFNPSSFPFFNLSSFPLFNPSNFPFFNLNNFITSYKHMDYFNSFFLTFFKKSRLYNLLNLFVTFF